MNCKTARMLVELRGNRSDELPPEDAASLDNHLQACSECQRLLVAERRIDSHLAKAMQAVPVPPRLKGAILDRLSTQRGTMHRRRFFYVAAAAASVLLAVGLVTWKPQTKEKFDVNGLLVRQDSFVEDPKEKVNEWLAAQGIRYQPPVPFDPRLLAFHGTATLQGKQVPMLYYRSFERNVFAQVYILRDTDFDLTTLPETFGGSSVYGHQVKILRDVEQPNKLAYVILFNGDTLEPFLIKFGLS